MAQFPEGNFSIWVQWLNSYPNRTEEKSTRDVYMLLFAQQYKKYFVYSFILQFPL